MPAFFVTGTDTEIGKTTIAAGLLHAARRAGLSTAAAKLGRVPRLEEATPAAVAAHLDLRPLGIGL
ncbi:hypothetical protein Z046_03995 [Pseudomonas aeruginosa VRFPA09]|nr:hypothetical protein Z046_03995 [Pseudomonas aeruginosa VRFPA09]